MSYRIEINHTMRLPIIRCDDSIPSDLVNSNNNNNNHQNERKLDLPVPSFRQAKNLDKSRNHTAKKVWKGKRTDSYYHYEEPSEEELNERVEYDMDLEDIIWLEKFNDSYGKKNNYLISESEFEKIMDRLEKESYFENQRSGKDLMPEVDQDAVCVICNDGDCNNANVIIFCEMCNLAVHQECYGVPYIPEGQWLCRRCLHSPLRNVDCELCPNVDGAFKQTNDNKWVHVICALWIPEVSFANTVFLEPIENLHLIQSARWKLNCYICKQKKIGACIQCSKQNCYQSFHVTCAQQAKLYMKISTCEYDDKAGGTFIDVKKEVFCDSHTPKDAKASGGMYSGDETDEDVNTEDYKRKNEKRRKYLKKTRKLLAEKREELTGKDTALITVDAAKLAEIAKCFGARGRKSSDWVKLRRNYVDIIHEYWRNKRIIRNGVPLLRRLQVADYHRADPHPEEQLNKDSFERLRYDLEKCRLLLGEVGRREKIKKQMFVLSAEIIKKKLDEIDQRDPPEED